MAVISDTVAVALITGFAAVIGGLMGAGATYFGTMKSQRRQHDEDHLIRRQEAYQAYLDSAYRFIQASRGSEELTDDDWVDLFRDLRHNGSAVDLLGTSKARKASYDLTELFKSAMGSASEDAASSANDDPAVAYERVRAKIDAAWTNAVEAMRRDVGPGQ